jgi:acetolactate decarboxylase
VANMKGNDLIDNKDTIYQVSTYGILLQGSLDGFISIKDLKTMGDFGIGSITGLDGEVIVLNGKFYHANVNGDVRLLGEDAMSPKMLISWFKGDQSVLLTGSMSYQELKNFTESVLPTKNIMYGIKIEANFKYVRTECFPKKDKPYPHAISIASSKKILEKENIDGVLVGYIMPEHFGEIAAVRYHLHFISADEKLGGHLVEFELTSGKMTIDNKHNLQLLLPKTDDYYDLDLSKTSETLKEFEIILRDENEPKNLM